MFVFDQIIRESAIQHGIYDHITVYEYFIDSHSFFEYCGPEAGVVYSYLGTPPKRFVELFFGSVVGLLTTCELRELIAHEFAHIQAGHNHKLICRILFTANRFRPWPLRTSVLRMFESIVQIRRCLLGKRQEFQADRIACTFVPSDTLARVLVKMDAYECAVAELQRHGTTGSSKYFSDASSSLNASQIYDLSAIEIVRLISEKFQANRRFFQLCSQKAKQVDRASWTHPSTNERLKRLGLGWDTVEESCNFESEELIDIDAFEKWIVETNPGGRHYYFYR